MAEQTFSKRYLEESSEESDSDNDSDYELARQDISETVTHVQADGAVQMGQGNSIVTHHNKNSITQNINVNVTAHFYIQNDLPPITVDHQQRLGFNQNSSGQTNNLNLDLGEFGSLRIPLPVSSREGARAACSDAQIETKREDLPVLSDYMTRTSSDIDPVQTRFFQQKIDQGQSSRHQRFDSRIFNNHPSASAVIQTAPEHQRKGDLTRTPKQDSKTSKTRTPSGTTSFCMEERSQSSLDLPWPKETQSGHATRPQIKTKRAPDGCVVLEMSFSNRLGLALFNAIPTAAMDKVVKTFYGQSLDYHIGQSKAIGVYETVGAGNSQEPSFHLCGNE